MKCGRIGCADTEDRGRRVGRGRSNGCTDCTSVLCFAVKLFFPSHLQLLSTSAKIELRATVEPQGARSVPQMWRIAATHEASAFCLPWNRTAASLRPLHPRHFVRPGPRLSGTGSARFWELTPIRSDQPPAVLREQCRIYWPVNHGSLLRP